MSIRCAAGLVLGAWLALGCGETQEKPKPAPRPTPTPPRAEKPAPPSQPAVADGVAIFRMRCVTCHGENGDGRGPASAGLDPAPRDFGDPAWQAKVSDDHIENVIAVGGLSLGLSAAMPAHPDLSPGELAAVRAHIRSLAR
jgi:mono/diheme cytochrome c family protein